MIDNILDGDDGIGTLGHGSAGGDTHRLACRKRARRGAARGDPLDDGKPPRRVRARERWQVGDGTYVCREHAPERRRQRYGLGRKGPDARKDLPKRFLDREQGCHGRRILGA